MLTSLGGEVGPHALRARGSVLLGQCQQRLGRDASTDQVLVANEDGRGCQTQPLRNTSASAQPLRQSSIFLSAVLLNEQLGVFALCVPDVVLGAATLLAAHLVEIGRPNRRGSITGGRILRAAGRRFLHSQAEFWDQPLLAFDGDPLQAGDVGPGRAPHSQAGVEQAAQLLANGILADERLPADDQRRQSALLRGNAEHLLGADQHFIVSRLGDLDHLDLHLIAVLGLQRLQHFVNDDSAVRAISSGEIDHSHNRPTISVGRARHPGQGQR